MKKITLSFLLSILCFCALAQNSDKPNNKYGNNLITFAPMSIIDKGLGIGFSYERMLDAEQKIALVLPLDFVFTDLSINQIDLMKENLTYTYFSPGLIFYPSGLKKVNYGIGPNLVLTHGKGEEWIFTNNNIQELQAYKNFRMGIMVNNYLLMNIKRHFSLQLNFGMGIRYINNTTFNANTSREYKFSDPISLMAQFKFTFGYRF